MRLFIADDAEKVGEYTAEYVIKRVNAFNPTEERPFVLGLPTGGYTRLFSFLIGRRKHPIAHLP